MVLKNNDPTAHAEVVTIRNACSKLNTNDLKGYVLYTTVNLVLCVYQQ
jgi:tRNA(Arg) A34 adenosine deaminase TadA